MYSPVVDCKLLESISVHSYRGDKQEYKHGYNSLHPKNILTPEAELFYASEISSKFNQNEPNDWIIFFQNDDSNKGQYYPFNLKIQNRDWEYIYSIFESSNVNGK